MLELLSVTVTVETRDRLAGRAGGPRGAVASDTVP